MAESSSPCSSPLITVVPSPSGLPIIIPQTYASGPSRRVKFVVTNPQDYTVQVDSGYEFDRDPVPGLKSAKGTIKFVSETRTGAEGESVSTDISSIHLPPHSSRSMSFLYSPPSPRSPSLSPSILFVEETPRAIRPRSELNGGNLVVSDGFRLDSSSEEGIAEDAEGLVSLPSALSKSVPAVKADMEVMMTGKVFLKAKQVVAVDDPEEQLEEKDSETKQPDNVSTVTELPFQAIVAKSFFSAAAVDDESLKTPSLPPQQQASQTLTTLSPSTVSLVLETSTSTSSFSADFTISNHSPTCPLNLSVSTRFDSCPFRRWIFMQSLAEDGEEFALGGLTESSPPNKLSREIAVIPPNGSRMFRAYGRIPSGEYTSSADGDFLLDAVLININNPSNSVLLKMTLPAASTTIGNALSPFLSSDLTITSGPTLSFGDLVRGGQSRRVMKLKNLGAEVLDVRFGSEEGPWEVTFKLEGEGDGEVERELRRGATSSTTSNTSNPFSSYEQLSNNVSPTKSNAAFLPVGSPSEISRKGRFNSLADEYSSSSTHRSSSVARFQTKESGDDADSVSAVSSNSVSFSDPLPPIQLPSQLGTSSRRPFAGVLHATHSLGAASHIDELQLKPGHEYRVVVMFKPKTLTIKPDEEVDEEFGKLKHMEFRVTLDYTTAALTRPSSSASSSGGGGSGSGSSSGSARRFSSADPRRRRIVTCSSRVCSSLLSVSPQKLDFGDVMVGSSKSSNITIRNTSDLPTTVELRFISKVISTTRTTFSIPPRGSVTEKIDFFPRRINPSYRKELNVRNVMDRSNDHLIEVVSNNVDLEGITLHSHLYRILTPSGLNVLDFGSVTINSPTIRTITFDNTSSAPLRLKLNPAHPEDIALYVKATEQPPSPHVEPSQSQCIDPTTPLKPQLSFKERGYGDEIPDKPLVAGRTSNKERFLESMAAKAEKGEITARFPAVKAARARDKSVVRGVAPSDVEKHEKSSGVGAALKKGTKGKTVQVYGNGVVFKDRSLLSGAEYLDLAAGPPLASHRTSPRNQYTKLDSIENDDNTKISGKHPKIAKLLFADHKKTKVDKTDALGSTAIPEQATKSKKPKNHNLTHQPVKPLRPATPPIKEKSASTETKSPALTGRRRQKISEVDATDVSGLTLDELLVALETHDTHLKTSMLTKDAEEVYVRTLINLRKELQNAIHSGKLILVDHLSIASHQEKQVVVVLNPSGSTRPHVQGDRARKQDTRIFVKLIEFDRSLGKEFPGLAVEDSELPVREFLVRSSMTRSILELAQTHVNFGNMDKGEVKTKTIVIHNRSDCPGMFRIRLSGKISSNDFTLHEGRYGVVEAFGSREVAGFTFTPSMSGVFNEQLVVENIGNSEGELRVTVKAVVRKTYQFWVSPMDIDLGDASWETSPCCSNPSNFTLQNSSKNDRTFIVEVDPSPNGHPAELQVQLDDGKVKAGLTKAEDEEVENILQKLKINRRKGKMDKVEKYEARLKELGVPIPAATTTGTEAGGSETPATPSEAIAATSAPVPSIPPLPSSVLAGPDSKSSSSNGSTDAPEEVPSLPTSKPPTPPPTPALPMNRISLVLSPNQTQSISVKLALCSSNTLQPCFFEDDIVTHNFCIRVWEKKNTDDLRHLNITCRGKRLIFPIPPPTAIGTSLQ